MTIASVNGVDLYYEIHGSGEPLFLTHGSWGDATAWEAVVPGLADRFEVVIWDRRGHARSTNGEGPGSYEEDASDLAALIEHLDLEGAHVYGSSAGGTIVLKLVAARPDLITSAAVHEPAVTGLLDGAEDDDIVRGLTDMRMHLDRVRTLIEAERGRAAAEYFIENVAVGPGAWEGFPEETKSALASNAGTYADEIAEGGWVVDPDALAAGAIPLMITLGTESPPLILRATRELIRRLPSARVVTLDGSGHVPYRTHPELWLDTFVTYFREVRHLAQR